MAMFRDGLLPSFFLDVNKHTQVPVKSAILTGICAPVLAFFMDVSLLAGMVSVDTPLAFTIVAISILILRYVPPDEVPLPSSLQESIDSLSLYYGIQEKDGGSLKNLEDPLILKEDALDKLNEQKRRKHAAWSISCVCIGVLIVTSSASIASFPGLVRYSICAIGGFLLLGGVVVLSWIEQDDGRHSFGHAGGFICPFVPLLLICCILINAYLLINLGVGTWMRVSMWLLIGVFVYLFYGRSHSSLTDVVYVPVAHADRYTKLLQNMLLSVQPLLHHCLYFCRICSTFPCCIIVIASILILLRGY